MMNQKQALTLGLYLAVIAPTEEKAHEVGLTLASVAHGMSKKEVAQCKRAAMARVRRLNRRMDGALAV
jgi:hypothetical protein